MSSSGPEAFGKDLPETMTWEELDQLPGDVAKDVELWEGRVVWNRRPLMGHQRAARRVCNALEVNARRAMRAGTDGERRQCWEVEVETNIFFKADKSSFLTPDFFVRRCLPREADTFTDDTVLVGEVLSNSDTDTRREWKMERYAEAGIPWYWEIRLDIGGTWDVASVKAYDLYTVDQSGHTVQPLRPVVYMPVGEWEPTGPSIDFPEPFAMSISWEDLAY
ncbi:Uma2 family endonuclease [Streptomyces sp. TRM66268-LWL]|uniref:Uma2 family endonuclease n=1 Tax=Streptomyces polyasparticus TaxID=2767826 RepID=A0ABR7SMH8_9ACTN|nr:Uma2 family endonuclease [Streptomyces polyasparticus]MBC9716554.1 Uma2 family endonuclease [Streptomyces polyasparticus]